MTSSRKTHLAMAAVAISIAGTVAIVVVVGLAASIQSEEAPDTSVVAIQRPIPSDVYDPVRAGEEPPNGFRQLLGRDQIAPVYDPVCVARDKVDWPADVIDTLDGTPVLASW